LHGSAWGDFAFRGDGGEDILISEQAAQLFRDEGLSGLTGFEPVEITRIVGSSESMPPPTYLHVAVIRTDATVDEQRSSLIRPEPASCNRCRSAPLEGVRGFALQSPSWTGEDVFFTRGLSGVVIASQKFSGFVDRHDLANVRFVPTERYEWNPYRPLSP
jgi:hypothetical protein